MNEIQEYRLTGQGSEAVAEEDLDLCELEEMYDKLSHDLKSNIKNEQAMRSQLIQVEKFAILGRMVASVAHELDNPLQTIKNCLFLAQQDIPPGAAIQAYMIMAASETQRISNLVMQLRDVYRPKSAIQMIPLDLGAILEDIHSLISPHLQRHKTTWRHSMPSTCYKVKGIVDELKQVFLNISLNAIDAMQPEGGDLIVSEVIRMDRKQIGVEFKDTGPGIDPENIPRLFDPTFTTKDSGTGLGLYISLEIVKQHGGLIEVASRLGQGATFTVWLPLLILRDSQPEPG